MPLNPINYELSVFEKLEICRLQEKDRQEELEQVEMKIRTIHYELQKTQYLHTLNSAYPAQHPDHENLTVEIQKLEKRRSDLAAIIDSLQKTIPTITKSGSGAAASAAGKPSAAFGGGQKADSGRAMSLDDFKQRFPDANL